jgi:hypothetical protein
MFRESDRMLGKTILAGYLVLLAAAPALAQSSDHAGPNSKTLPAGQVNKGGTTQENDACRRDTRRLCRHVKPEDGNDGFLKCLQDHRASLSKDCRQVLESHGV